MSNVLTATPPSLPEVNPKSLRENPPNARRTIEALRELGYDSYGSVMDLLDNSIDAHATRVEVAVSESRGDIVITIADDGVGMDDRTLDEALRLGSDTERDSGDLGKFGLGLVTASIGLSRRLEVFTREEHGPVLHGGFDLDQISSEDRFVKWIQEIRDSNQLLPHGTMIRLSKTDRISNRSASTFANTLRKKISQVFRKFLKAGVHISVNGKAAEPFDPLMLTHPESTVLLDTQIETDGGAFELRIVDLPDFGSAGNSSAGIIPQNSGFYVLRNNREIIEAHTFDFYKKHPDFSHFRGEIIFDGSLDQFFHTDVKKMSITPSQAILDRLRQATTALITDSARQARSRANVGKGQVDHGLAEANIGRRATLIPKPKALVEKRTQRGEIGTHSRGQGDRSRTPHMTDLKTISGLRVRFEEANHGDGPFYNVRQDGKTILVTYNREHPFWRELLEHATDPKVVATLDYVIFALANAELLVPEQARIVKENVNATLVGLLV